MRAVVADDELLLREGVARVLREAGRIGSPLPRSRRARAAQGTSHGRWPDAA